MQERENINNIHLITLSKKENNHKDLNIPHPKYLLRESPSNITQSDQHKKRH